ncbi:phage late control D family protein [Succinimonas amylolytica]|uniref:phage late control D family protein n=1 Tax=Succinimonas amylolytica TaxID=83769 RepID=UPI0023A8441D
MLKKEIKISYIRDCSLSDAVPYRCVLNEGISIPFRAEITLFSDKQLARKDLDSCLRVKTELAVMQYDTAGLLCRGRKFQGIITAYKSLGLVSDISGSFAGDDCYGYEITLEPEMVLMGLKRRTRSFDSSSTPADIITGIFEEYHLKCLFDNALFDSIPDHGQIAQQNNETDLNFINRICFNYGFNYFFEFAETDSSTAEDSTAFSEALTVFSRGWRVSNATQITGNTLTGLQEIPCTVGEQTSENFGSGTVSLTRLVNSGYMGAGNIDGDEEALQSENTDSPVFTGGFESRRGEGSGTNDSIASFASDSCTALDRLTSGHEIISAGDFAIAPGLSLRLDSQSHLLVRAAFSFNIAFPEGFKAARDYDQEEQELRLVAVAVPLPDDTQDTLGPLCCFGRIPENPTAESAFQLTGIPRPGQGLGMHRIASEKAALTANPSGESAPLIYRATVCDATGQYGAGDGASSGDTKPGMIVPASDDDTAFPAMFYAIIDGAAAAVVVNYISISGGSAPLGNFPKIAQRILIIMAGGSYYLMGYLPDRNALPTFHKEMRDDLMHSSFLASGVDPRGSDNTDRQTDNSSRDVTNQYLNFTRFSSSALLIEYLIMQNRLETFLNCLSVRYNSIKIAEIYTLNKDSIDTDLKAVTDARTELDKAIASGKDVDAAKLKLSNAYTALSSLANTLVGSIKDIKQISDVITSMKDSNPVLTDDAALSSILGLSTGALFFDGVLREYSSSLERCCSQDVTVNAGGNVKLHAAKNVVITADSTITLQVGNSTININGNTIAAAVSYFKYKIAPWDARIVLSPTSGVTVSGYQFNAKSLMSSSIADSFGGSVSSKTGFGVISAPLIKISTMNGPSFIRTITGLATRTMQAIANIPCTAVNNKASQMADSIINDIAGYANSISGIVADTITAINNWKLAGTRGTRGTKDVITLIVSGIAIAMDAADVLEALVANTIIKNIDQDNSYTARNQANNYVSGHDIYLMTTSSVRTTAMITKAVLLMASNMTMVKTSSVDVNSMGVTLTGTNLTLSATSKKELIGPNVSNDLKIIEENNLINVDDDDASSLTKIIGTEVSKQSTNAGANVTETTLQISTSSQINERNPVGEEDLKVSKNEVDSVKEGAHGSKNEQSAAKDDVSGASGSIKTGEVKGSATQSSTVPLENSNDAVSTGVGALDTDTTGMKVNS